MNKLESHNKKLEAATDKESLSIVAGDYDISQISMASIEQEVNEKELYYKELDKINFELKQ